jgi:hypothetical protein
LLTQKLPHEPFVCYFTAWRSWTTTVISSKTRPALSHAMASCSIDARYVFVISNGGACAQFSTVADCQEAAVNIEAIVAGNNLSA